MFGVVVPGRPLLTEFQKLSDTQIKFTIPAQPDFSHIVIFALPTTELPVGAAAAVYIQISPSTDFKLLGALSNEKQSTIFKIRSADVADGVVAMDEIVTMELTPVVPGQLAEKFITLGISLEPIAQVEVNLAALKATQSTPTTSGSYAMVRSSGSASTPFNTKILAQRIIANAFNFLASFASGGTDQVVPLKIFEQWWKKFEKKIELDPGFLEREDQ